MRPMGLLTVADHLPFWEMFSEGHPGTLGRNRADFCHVFTHFPFMEVLLQGE